MIIMSPFRTDYLVKFSLAVQQFIAQADMHGTT